MTPTSPSSGGVLPDPAEGEGRDEIAEGGEQETQPGNGGGLGTGGAAEVCDSSPASLGSNLLAEAPKRIQLRRTKGWRKPEGTVVVSRPSKWGNPFKVGERYTPESPQWGWLANPLQPADLLAGLSSVTLRSRAQAVEIFGWWFIQQPDLMVTLRDITGHDLACWCPLDQPCHADVLLDLANRRPGDPR